MRDPEEVAAGPSLHGAIADDTTVGAVHLTVADVDRSIDYYRQAIGLEVLERADGGATVGAGTTELLVLDELPGARPADGYSGLYHFALRVPTRADLARWLAHAVRDRVALTGLSDHVVSEAIYLRDPDHHGIEIYADRPRELWEGDVANRITSIPLDTDDLLGELDDPRSEPFDALPSGTVMGHVHLRVASIPETVAFYRDVVGFGVTAMMGNQAAFLSAGGYHHHLGANIWESAGAPAAPPETATLRHWTIVLPSAEDREETAARIDAAGQEPEDTPAGPLFRDPSGNAIVLAT